MERSNELEKKIGNALELLSKANSAMIDCINQAVEESENKVITYIERIKFDYYETRYIKNNESGELTMFDDYDNELTAVNDLTANELYDIILSYETD